MRRLPTALLLLAALTLPGCLREVRPAPAPAQPQATFTQAADALFASIEAEGAMTSVLVVDAETGEPLYSRREHGRSLPASTMKVVSTAAALSALGPDFRFRTPVQLSGTRQGELFDGELIVEASGDPSLGSWRFPETAPACDQIAEAMWGRGIRKWRGALRVVSPDTGLDGPLGPGWAWDDVAYFMSAAPMPFVFRENAIDLALVRAEGAPCSAQPSLQVTPRFAPFTAVVQIDTGGPSSGFACLREHNPTRTRCVWRSTANSCPRSTSTRLTVDDPRALFSACVEDALTRRGIARLPSPQVAREPAPAPRPAVTELLTELVSPSLAALVKETNKDSNNLYAERLALRFARERVGAEDYQALRKAMSAELTRRGISSRDLRPIDGSGLSRYNLATARGLVQVLFTSLKEPYGQALLESLPIAGIDGTLGGQALSSEALARVRAKTGTLSSQKAYVGVAERPHDPKHPRVVFSLMMGNMDEQPAVSAVGAFGQFAEALTQLPLR
ncbi:MAG TPA: D-alanyl-D-alanine carboxypeptidase/D-alanyl-D-alanine-endopeptidase [Myxococcaceae bacterium]